MHVSLSSSARSDNRLFAYIESQLFSKRSFKAGFGVVEDDTSLYNINFGCIAQELTKDFNGKEFYHLSAYAILKCLVYILCLLSAS